LRAFSTAAASRAFNSGSAPPILAATMISRTSLPVFCPFLSEATARLACNHWRPMRQGGRLAGVSAHLSRDLTYAFSASFIEVPFVGIFVGNLVDRAFADKVCDKVSDKDGTLRW